MIDLHSHVLPGIDDGPASMEGSCALARAAEAAGTSVLVATPHVSEHYRNDARSIERLVKETNAAFASEGLALQVLGGAEIASERIADLSPGELAALSLGGGPWLLLECPLSRADTGFGAIALYLRQQGHQIVLAHPERSPTFQRDPGMLRSLVDAGMLTSVTAGALVGRFGRDVRRFATQLAEQGLVHNVASDTHDTSRRPPGIRAELQGAGLEQLADWFTSAVPQAILSGDPIPQRPVPVATGAPQPKRRWWSRTR